MKFDTITRAWLALIALSAASVAATTGVSAVLGQSLFGALVLAFAWAKARIILSRYLGLYKAPGWQSGFNWALGLFCVLLLGLYVAPGLMPAAGS